jgi:hypothetical protein
VILNIQSLKNTTASQNQNTSIFAYFKNQFEADFKPTS